MPEIKQETAPESRKEVGKRLTQLYENMKLSRHQFADALGMKYETLRSYEKGQAEPGSLFFKRLTEVYPGADVGYILTGRKRESERMAGALEIRRVPVVHSIPAGGFLEGIPDEEIVDQVFTTDLKTKGLFGLIVKGHSMEPDVYEGDIVVFAPDLPFVNGKVYAVVSQRSEATLKKVYRTKEGWTLVPLNPAFESRVLPEDEVIKLYRMVSINRKYL